MHQQRPRNSSEVGLKARGGGYAEATKCIKRGKASQVYDKMPQQSWMQLKDLTPTAFNSINATVILVEKERIVEEGKEKTKTCIALVADETACVNFQMWGAECEPFHPGDIIRISKGIFSRHKNKLLLRAGKKGTIEKVGEFTILFVETPNMSEMRYVPGANRPIKLVPGSQLTKP